MSDTEQLYEHVLVLQCRAGNEAAFACLIASYQPRLRYYLRQLLREPDNTEDILQDVWLDVFQSLPRLKNIASFSAWLYTIVRFRAMRERRKPALSQRLQDPEEVIDEYRVETNVLAENAEHIHVALQTLADEHREVLMLRFLEEMSYEEMAHVIGCPLGTVASRIHHAKRALRAALERTTCYE